MKKKDSDKFVQNHTKFSLNTRALELENEESPNVELNAEDLLKLKPCQKYNKKG